MRGNFYSLKNRDAHKYVCMYKILNSKCVNEIS